MKPYYEKEGITIYHGDCLEVMQEMEAESVDSIVTDPPYGLSFMGKDWDHGIPGVRLTCAIEDASPQFARGSRAWRIRGLSGKPIRRGSLRATEKQLFGRLCEEPTNT